MALTLDGNGTMTVGNGDITGLVAGALPSTVIGAGAVLQVVSAVTTTQVSIASSSYTSTGFSASITPTSSTSKILIMGSVIIRNGTASNNYQHTIYRGATQLAPISARGFIQTRGDSSEDMTVAFQFLDSPATTSSTTYTWYHKSEGTVTCYFAIDGSYAQLTLLEIAA